MYKKKKFQLVSEYQPAGDQPKAITDLVEGLEKGHRYQTLLGVTGSGKSVTPDTVVTIKRDNKIRQCSIGDFVNELFVEFYDKIEQVDETEVLNASRVKELTSYETLSLDPVNQTQSWKSITQLSRHKVAADLYRITTSCGRQVTVTADHNFYVLDNGLLNLRETGNLLLGDYLPIPRYLGASVTPLREINLVDYVSPEVRVGLYTAVPDSIFNQVGTKKRLFMLAGREKAWRIKHAGERISVDLLERIAPYSTRTLSLGLKRRIGEYPFLQPISDVFMRTLGYYIAEGHSSETYLIITTAAPEIVQDLRSYANELGLRITQRASLYDYQISSKTLSDIFGNVCGRGSYKKQLPVFWPMLSDQHLGQLLSGYFSGDGGVDGLAVTATTVSERLASDLAYALFRFGIHARIHEKRYTYLGKKRLGYIISISGQSNLKKFAAAIGFSIIRKQEALKMILGKHANTNVDVMPGVGAMLKQMRCALRLDQIDLAQEIGIERSYISMIENGKRDPSCDLYQQLIVELRRRAVQVNHSAIIAQCDTAIGLAKVFWSPIKSIDRVSDGTYVYDFAVQDNETFLAGRGGLFVHNTFTMANVIQQINKPTLVIAPNKTLAAQLYQEYQSFFPHNKVCYFVSYYDYYQPEAYLPVTDTYIEKEAMINEEIDRFRHVATSSLLTRSDVIVVASVSCIYNLGVPENYFDSVIGLEVGRQITRGDLLKWLIKIGFKRNNIGAERGSFRVRGDVFEVYPASEQVTYKITLNPEQVITELAVVDTLTRKVKETLRDLIIFPPKHFVTTIPERERAIKDIKAELKERLVYLNKKGLLLEAERLERRTKYDVEMISTLGFCHGIENYSRHLSGKPPGSPPDSLMSYFPKDKNGKPDFLTIIDESHIAVPQVAGMYAGDQSRKKVLVEFGWRLPSAMDNRPLNFKEFEERIGQTIFTSATPAQFEKDHASQVVEQIVRPTGLVDPPIEIRPVFNREKNRSQIDDVIEETIATIKKGEKTLIITLTKKQSEELAQFLTEKGFRAKFMHSDTLTMERTEILKGLRSNEFDVLIGVNLLREGLDLPEVSLVAILDADREGFLRSEVSLIQTMGRAARNLGGRVILYADKETGSMKRAISECERRRKIQLEYNKKHKITPRGITKEIREFGA